MDIWGGNTSLEDTRFTFVFICICSFLVRSVFVKSGVEQEGPADSLGSVHQLPIPCSTGQGSLLAVKGTFGEKPHSVRTEAVTVTAVHRENSVSLFLPLPACFNTCACSVPVFSPN